jgi:transcription-repair coupling factor (superfamily II helicase)
VSEINLRTPALLPNDYCPDVHERLTLYKRLANCDSDDDLRACAKNWSTASARCRPDPALLETHRLRSPAKPLGMAKIDAGPARRSKSVRAQPADRAGRIIQLVQKDRNFKLAGLKRTESYLGAAEGSIPCGRRW